jgi:hypothetical protein
MGGVQLSGELKRRGQVTPCADIPALCSFASVTHLKVT